LRCCDDLRLVIRGILPIGQVEPIRSPSLSLFFGQCGSKRVLLPGKEKKGKLVSFQVKNCLLFSNQTFVNISKDIFKKVQSSDLVLERKNLYDQSGFRAKKTLKVLDKETAS